MKHYLLFAILAFITIQTFKGQASATALSVMTEVSEQQQPPQKKQKIKQDEGNDPSVDLVVADETSENLAPWDNRWKNKRIGFHQKEVNPVLKKYILQLLPPNNNHKKKEDEKDEKVCSSNRRVFVPLCGKTVDMPFLVTMADAEVVGVEGIRQAIEEFSEEQPDLKMKLIKGTTTKEGDCKFEQFQGENITLLRGDYFELDSIQTGGTFNAIYDRASMVAIEPELRTKYVDIMGKLIAPGGKILLIVLERQGQDEEARNKGPPYSIPDVTVRDMFERQDWVKSITLLQEIDQFELKPEDRKRYEGLDKLMEVVYLIQAKY